MFKENPQDVWQHTLYSSPQTLFDWPALNMTSGCSSLNSGASVTRSWSFSAEYPSLADVAWSTSACQKDYQFIIIWKTDASFLFINLDLRCILTCISAVFNLGFFLWAFLPNVVPNPSVSRRCTFAYWEYKNKHS